MKSENEAFTCGMFQAMMEKTRAETAMTTVTTLEDVLVVVIGL